MIIGPVLKRFGGYGFDVWFPVNAVIPHYPYRCIEDAYCDRMLTLKAALQTPPMTVTVCETIEMFQSEIERARRIEPLHRRVERRECDITDAAAGD